MTTDHQHFGRPELAQAYLATFERADLGAQPICPDSDGQTAFPKQDLIPAATAAGYFTAYTNL